MKASHRWLRALVPGLTNDPNELAARFTGAGLEVEGMHTYGAGAEACVVAEVVSIRPHPSKSGLRLVTVERGGGTQEVVCGAPNVPDPGGLVVLAPLGAHLPAKGMTIERRAIGGIESEGMLCSESELGLSEDSEGILILARELAKPGTRLLEAVPEAHDTIFEIGLTPNRPDGLGHIGLAREAAALFGLPFALPEIKAPAKADGDAASFVQVAIEDGERCPHYAAGVLVGSVIGPSPLWLRYRLSSLGVRPISSVVDITNLVLLEYGHPLHAFDLDKVRGARIVVRSARQGEILKTLDGVDRTLTSDDLVICDGEGPVALAGVMGGGDSEISASTKRVLLECAYFDPRSVRRSSRRHGLHTEASHRFERGIDHGDTRSALARASSLVAELSGAREVPGVVHVVARALAAPQVTVRSSRTTKLLGCEVPRQEARAILERLGFVFIESDGDADTFQAPTHRPDIAREVDLIEEIARVRGFEAIPTVLPAIRPARDEGARESIARRTRAAAVELGLSEAITYGFVSARALEIVGAPTSTITLANPLSETQAVMRTSLLPGLLDAAGRARRHGEGDVALFTVGSTFLASAAGEKLPHERMEFALVLTGERPAHLTRPSPVDVWDAKGLALGLVDRVARANAEVVAYPRGQAPKHVHPRGAARVVVQGADVGRLGPLHPDVADALDLRGAVLVVELDLAALDALGRATPTFTPIPKFPASTRDASFVVHDDVPAGEVERAVCEAAGELAEQVSLLDRFVGGTVPESHASLTFHIVYRAKDRTLTDDDVQKHHDNAVKEVGKRFGATLRA